jgi:chromatin segregation and condensation protein Rec8/ScpA/Scc1 (kleisin family)
MTFPDSPYELVFYLLEKKNLDLTPKNLAEILRDFWLELEKSKIPTEIVGDFLVAFSKLLLLKINYLLGILEEEPEILVDLEKYKVLKKAKRNLKKLIKKGPVYLSRNLIEFVAFLPPLNIRKEDLRSYLQNLIKEREFIEKEEIISRRISLEEAFGILERILSQEKEIIFQEKFKEKDLLVALFLAILIWFREGKLELEQEEIFGKIKVKIKNKVEENGTE